MSSTKEGKIFNNQWILKKKVSSGSFGVVFIGQDKNTKEFVAIKLEKEDNEEIRSLDREVQILQRLQDIHNIPKLHWSGTENNYNIMVINLLGRDLAYYMKILKKFSIKSVLLIIDQIIPLIESVHNRCVIHRDLKPENILMGRESESNVLYLIDFGISKIYKDSNGRHISFKENKPFIGTTRYASIAAHLGQELGRKDDLESLGYVLIFFLKGSLPWQNLQNVSDKDKTQVVGDIKQKTKTADLCKDLPNEFVKYLEYVKKLHFKSTPDYKYIKNLFKKLGETMNIKYNAYEWDWCQTEKKEDKEIKSENQKGSVTSIFNQLMPADNEKKKPPSSSQQLLDKSDKGSEFQEFLLKPPDPQARNSNKNLSWAPNQKNADPRPENRKNTGSSFLSTFSKSNQSKDGSIYLKYTPSYRGSQANFDDFDEENKSVNQFKDVEEEMKNGQKDNKNQKHQQQSKDKDKDQNQIKSSANKDRKDNKDNKQDDYTINGSSEFVIDEFVDNSASLDNMFKNLIKTQVNATMKKDVTKLHYQKKSNNASNKQQLNLNQKPQANFQVLYNLNY